MSISNTARTVIERPLDQGRVKQRPGRGNMTFDYIPTDYVISLLNEAFDYKWDTKIVEHTQVENHVVVGLELRVWDDAGVPIVKQQFGSCEINRGVGPGDAFKGAASDALKKCATLLGIGLELYNPEEASSTGPSFTPPQRPAPPAAPAKPTTPGAVASPAPPRPPAAPKAPPRPPAAPSAGNPFAGGTTNTASVPKPAAPAAPPAPPAPPKAASVAAPRANPFGGGNENKGPNSTQLNALNNLAQKKGLSQSDMIALAPDVTDAEGNPVMSFEDLTHAQAIQVIKAAQL